MALEIKKINCFGINWTHRKNYICNWG